jgi:hypothetical protein
MPTTTVKQVILHKKGAHITVDSFSRFLFVCISVHLCKPINLKQSINLLTVQRYNNFWNQKSVFDEIPQNKHL